MSSTLLVIVIVFVALVATFVLGEWLVRRRSEKAQSDRPAYPDGLPYNDEIASS